MVVEQARAMALDQRLALLVGRAVQDLGVRIDETLDDPRGRVPGGLCAAAIHPLRHWRVSYLGAAGALARSTLTSRSIAAAASRTDSFCVRMLVLCVFTDALMSSKAAERGPSLAVLTASSHFWRVKGDVPCRKMPSAAGRYAGTWRPPSF